MPVCFLIFHGPALYLAQKDTLEARTPVITPNIKEDNTEGMAVLFHQANYDLSFVPMLLFQIVYRHTLLFIEILKRN